MLYVLTPNLISDLESLSNHPGMIYKNHEMEELILFRNGFSTMENVIFDAVRHLHRTTTVERWSRKWFIVRSWFDVDNADTQYHYDGSRNTNSGQWVYQYGTLYDDTLKVSKKFMSTTLEYIGDDILVHEFEKKIPVLDIVNSQFERHFKLLIPGEKDMFYTSNLKFNIPVSLLN